MQTVTVRGLTIGEGMPKICVPIVGQTRGEILQEAQKLSGIELDFIEWRIDWFKDVFDQEKVVEVAKELREILKDIPVLVTFRTKQEGGNQAVEIEQYKAIYTDLVISQTIDLIDVELALGDDVMKDMLTLAQRHGVFVVASSHNFDATPSTQEMINTLTRMQDLGADILKIAVMPQNIGDVLHLLEATQKMRDEYATRPLITMSMSGLGSISRVAGETFGSAVTFGSGSKASAPGQIEVAQLKTVLEILHNAL